MHMALDSKEAHVRDRLDGMLDQIQRREAVHLDRIKNLEQTEREVCECVRTCGPARTFSG